MPTYRVHVFDQWITATGLDYVEAEINARELIEIDAIEEIKSCDMDESVRCDEL
jgi:hypothetical protein